MIRKNPQILQNLVIRHHEALLQDLLPRTVITPCRVADQICSQPRQQRHRRDDEEDQQEIGATGQYSG